MNVAPANTPRYATELTEQEQWPAKITNERNLRNVKQLDAINMRIASKQTIDSLKEQGLIYEDEHGEPHVTEQKNSTTNLADQS